MASSPPLFHPLSSPLPPIRSSPVSYFPHPAVSTLATNRFWNTNVFFVPSPQRETAIRMGAQEVPFISPCFFPPFFCGPVSNCSSSFKSDPPDVHRRRGCRTLNPLSLPPSPPCKTHSSEKSWNYLFSSMSVRSPTHLPFFVRFLHFGRDF